MFRLATLAFLCGALFSAGSAIASMDPVGDIQRLDPQGNKDLAFPEPNSWQHPSGIQIHKSCFHLAAQARIPWKTFKQGLNNWIADTISMVVNNCRPKYPELNLYTGEWMSRFRRTLVVCSQQNSYKDGLNARGIMSPSNQNMDEYLGKNETLWLPKLFLTDQPYSIVVMPRDAILSIAGKKDGSFWAVDSLVHEVFHSTVANNRADHAAIEQILPEQTGPCAANTTLDRISVLTSLCTGESFPTSVKTAVEALFERMRSCGASDGCENMFQSSYDGSPLSYHLTSRGLSPGLSRAVCRKIWEQGSCVDSLHERGAEITAGIAEMNRVGSRVAARVDTVLPTSANQVPLEFLKIFPKLESDLKSLAGSACFSALFNTLPDGSLLIRDAVQKDLQFLLRSKRAEYDFAASWNAIGWSEMQGAVKGCEDQSDRSAVFNFLSDLSLYMDKFQNSMEFRLMAGPRYTQTQTQTQVVETIAAPFTSDTDIDVFRQVLGPALYTQYLAALDRYHYSSPHFDCKAAKVTVPDYPR